MRNRNDDLTSRWAFNPRNPRGPKPDTTRIETYAERVQREYTQYTLYGPSTDRKPSKPKRKTAK